MGAAGQVTRINQARRLQADERATTILRLRSQGIDSWAAICKQVGCSEPTARSLLRRIVDELAQERRELAGAEFEQILSGLHADLAVLNGALQETRMLKQSEQAAAEAAGRTLRPAVLAQYASTVSKLIASKDKVYDKIIKLLGLEAPQKHAVLFGAAPQGEDLTDEQIAAMTPEEIEARLEADRQARAAALPQTVTVSVTPNGDEDEPDEDPEPDDGLPPELDAVIEDPGPRAVVPRGPAEAAPEPEAEGEGPGDDGREP